MPQVAALLAEKYALWQQQLEAAVAGKEQQGGFYAAAGEGGKGLASLVAGILELASLGTSPDAVALGLARKARPWGCRVVLCGGVARDLTPELEAQYLELCGILGSPSCNTGSRVPD